jgi:hypothetical protein
MKKVDLGVAYIGDILRPFPYGRHNPTSFPTPACLHLSLLVCLLTFQDSGEVKERRSQH